MIKYNAKDIIKQLPTYIPGQLIEDIKEKYNLDKIVKLASNENPFGAAVSILDVAENLTLDRYPDPECKKLKKRLASHYTISPEHLIFGNGSDELMQLIALAFLESKDTIITADVTFSEYEFVATLMGAETITVPLKENAYDLDGILDQITGRTKLIFIANPNNPTGTFIEREQIDAFLHKVPDDVVVVLDEAYVEYVSADKTTNSTVLLHTIPNLIVLRTFSKLYGLAGCRIGYAMANPELINILKLAKQPFNVNSVAAEAAFQALTQTEFIQKSLKGNDAGKKRLYNYFREKGISFQESETNFIYVDINTDAKAFCERCLKRGLILRPLTSFGRPDAIRVTIGTPEELDFLESVIDEVLE